MRESSFLIFGCFQVAAAYHTVEIRDDVVNINLDTNAILNKIGLEHPFVCANFDWWPDEKCDYGNCSWVGNGINKLDFDNEVLQAAATALSTSSTGYGANFGLLRIGGSLQDHINYDFTTMDEHCAPFPMKLDPNDHLGFDQGCVTIWKRDQIRKLAKDTGLQVVFGLNALKGRTKYEPYWNYTGDWDYTEAKKLLDEWPELFAVELGNEIAGHHGVTAHLDPKQYAKDFAVLLQLRNNLNIKRKPFVFGVDNALDLKWMDEFLGNLTRFSNSTIDTFTWHSYPLGAGALSKVDEEIMDPSFAQKIIHTGEEIRQWSKDKPFPVWMGETGGAYNSGRNTVTNRFMSAFWYLDWMGILSAAGHKSFCRQTLVGGNYGLLQNINGKMVPNPDFWGAKLFNDLLRGEVINVTSSNEIIHAYSTINTETSSISLLMLNYSPDDQYVKISEVSDKLLSGKTKMKMWLVTSAVSKDIYDLQSSDVYINGVKARFPKGQTNVPNPIEYGIESDPITYLQIPRHSYMFLTFE